MHPKIYIKSTTALVYGLLALMLCSNCNSKASQGGNRQLIWHTGYPQKPVNNEKYFNFLSETTERHSYTKYKVTHDGHCGFRAFIPIMLDYLLAAKNYHKKWLGLIEKEIFQKAKKALENDSELKKLYDEFSPTKSLSSSLQTAHALLAKLSQEKQPRRLEEDEIKTFIYFLRHLLLAKTLVIKHKGSPKENFKTQIVADNKARKKEWWPYPDQFDDIGIPFDHLSLQGNVYAYLPSDKSMLIPCPHQTPLRNYKMVLYSRPGFIDYAVIDAKL